MASLLVVGASLAGLRAAEAARTAGFEGSITIIGAEPHLPYDRPPLSKAFLDESDGPPSLHFRDEDRLREIDVTVVHGQAAERLDTDAREVVVGDRAYSYDALVIATGATARSMPTTLAGVHSLRTIDDAVAIRAALGHNPRVVVIGAGFIGSEVASAARKRGLAATVVEALPTPLARAIGPAMGESLSTLHQANGTDLRCGVGVDGLEGSNHVTGVRLVDSTVIPADLVVAGIGADPATDWLEGSGLRLDNGVVADESLAAGPPGVYVAGDVARWHNPLFGVPMRIEHWTNAAEMGAQAAFNALGLPGAKPYETVPYFWSDWYSQRIQFVGIPAAEEVVLAEGSVEAGKFTALYRTGDRVTGALTLNRRADAMKYRMQIAARGTFGDALALAASRA